MFITWLVKGNKGEKEDNPEETLVKSGDMPNNSAMYTNPMFGLNVES